MTTIIRLQAFVGLLKPMMSYYNKKGKKRHAGGLSDTSPADIDKNCHVCSCVKAVRRSLN